MNKTLLQNFYIREFDLTLNQTLKFCQKGRKNYGQFN